MEPLPQNNLPNIRVMLEEREKRDLSPYAKQSSETRGRETPLSPCDLRTEFQRDRDRIVHAKSFRRLMHKTQVFLSPEGDHYRTRLTHTLEVMQIARTIARALFLNEDLTEAIALGHDLGHTPFGHTGEAVLQECFDSSFTHYRQSLRVVERLENNGKGLNLTWEVRDGIVNHTGKHLASTLEGIIVKYADRIAYINHDIDDAVRAGILRTEDIPAHLRAILGETHGARIDTMIRSVVQNSYMQPKICMDERIGSAMNELRDFMFAHVYTNPRAKAEEAKAVGMLHFLYDYFLNHPTQMPNEYQTNTNEPVARHVCDYISGMTDRYATRMYQTLHNDL